MREKLPEGIRHADIGKQSVAAAHFAELRSFRRGYMALRASSTSFNEVYMILRFLLSWALLSLYTENCPMKGYFIMTFV